MGAHVDTKPGRCLVTRIGLLALAVAALAFAAIMVWQRVATGSFERGNGFLAPLVLKDVMLYGTPISLVVLVAGSLYDAARFSAWKRRMKAAGGA